MPNKNPITVPRIHVGKSSAEKIKSKEKVEEETAVAK